MPLHNFQFLYLIFDISSPTINLLINIPIKIIKETIGDSALIKAAGGVKDLDTLVQMIEAGCNKIWSWC